MQTTFPPFATGAVDGLKKVAASEGAGALYKSLPSLWGRQIPYTMVKFWSFEATVAKIYETIGKPKDEYNKLQQLGVSFAGGYIAGVFCAVVSQCVPSCTRPALTSQPRRYHGLQAQRPRQGRCCCPHDRIHLRRHRIRWSMGWSRNPYCHVRTRPATERTLLTLHRIGTLTALQWLLYDTLKAVVGLPTTGAAPAAEVVKA